MHGYNSDSTFDKILTSCLVQIELNSYGMAVKQYADGSILPESTRLFMKKGIWNIMVLLCQQKSSSIKCGVVVDKLHY